MSGLLTTLLSLSPCLKHQRSAIQILHFFLHRSLPTAPSRLSSTFPISFCIISIDLIFRVPLDFFPLTDSFQALLTSSSSLLTTCPIHRSLPSLTFTIIFSLMPNFLLTSSFLSLFLKATQDLSQHLHFRRFYLLLVFSSLSAFQPIRDGWANHRCIYLHLQRIWHSSIIQHSSYFSSFTPSYFNSFINIFLAHLLFLTND